MQTIILKFIFSIFVYIFLHNQVFFMNDQMKRDWLAENTGANADSFVRNEGNLFNAVFQRWLFYNRSRFKRCISIFILLFFGLSACNDAGIIDLDNHIQKPKPPQNELIGEWNLIAKNKIAHPESVYDWAFIPDIEYPSTTWQEIFDFCWENVDNKELYIDFQPDGIFENCISRLPNGSEYVIYNSKVFSGELRYSVRNDSIVYNSDVFDYPSYAYLQKYELSKDKRNDDILVIYCLNDNSYRGSTYHSFKFKRVNKQQGGNNE